MWRHDEDGNLIYVFHNAEYEHGRYGGRDAQVRRVHWRPMEACPFWICKRRIGADPGLCWCNDGGWFLRCRLSPLNDKRGIYAEANGGNGEHVVTMREVAKAAGGSKPSPTWSTTTNSSRGPRATRSTKLIAELGYTVNVSARNLRRGQTGIIGLAISDLQMPYFAQLSSLVIEEAKKVGLRVIVEPTQYSRDGELEALHGSQQTMIDGLDLQPIGLGRMTSSS